MTSACDAAAITQKYYAEFPVPSKLQQLFRNQSANPWQTLSILQMANSFSDFSGISQRQRRRWRGSHASFGISGKKSCWLSNFPPISQDCTPPTTQPPTITQAHINW